MYLWLCGITFFLILAGGLLLKHEMGIRGCARKRERMEEGE